MVNLDSPVFKFSEKIGLVIGTTIRYTLIGSGIIFLGGLLKNIKPSHSIPNNPPSPPPNRFDIRETFLNRMQDSEVRNNFLKAYNRRI